MSWKDTADKVMGICTRTFKTEAIYRSHGLPEKTISAIFNTPYIEGILLDGAPFQTKLYRLGVRLSDLDAAPSNKDRVEIEGTRYKVEEFRPDGDAGVVLILHKDV